MALSAPAAVASCGVPPGPQPSFNQQLRAAPVVFVGTVQYTWNNNRTARVKVESIWNGPTLPTYVDVHGEQGGCGFNCGFEGDHYYMTGRRYLFVPTNASPPFSDSGECNVLTREYTPDLTYYAPAVTRRPYPPTALDEVQNAAGRYAVPAGIAAIVVVITGGWLVIRRRRRVSSQGGV